MADPTVNLQLSLSSDGGKTWTTPGPLASGMGMDSFGQGSYTWTPTDAMAGDMAQILVRANDGTQPQAVSGAFLIASGGSCYYVSPSGNNANSGTSPDQPMASRWPCSRPITRCRRHDQSRCGRLRPAGKPGADGRPERGADRRAQQRSSGGAGPRQHERRQLRRADGRGHWRDARSLEHHWRPYGVYAASGADSTGLIVSNCDVYGNANTGIYLDSSNDYAQITGNQVHDDGFSGNYYSGSGIYIGSLGDLVSGNQVYGNPIGIYSDVSSNTAASPGSIQDNTVFGNQDYGIKVIMCPSSAIRSTASSSGSSAIVLYGGTASDNVVDNNATGMLIYRGEASGNSVYNNSIVGILADNPGWGRLPLRSRATLSTATASA